MNKGGGIEEYLLKTNKVKADKLRKGQQTPKNRKKVRKDDEEETQGKRTKGGEYDDTEDGEKDEGAEADRDGEEEKRGDKEQLRIRRRRKAIVLALQEKKKRAESNENVFRKDWRQERRTDVGKGSYRSLCEGIYCSDETETNLGKENITLATQENEAPSKKKAPAKGIKKCKKNMKSQEVKAITREAIKKEEWSKRNAKSRVGNQKWSGKDKKTTTLLKPNPPTHKVSA